MIDASVLALLASRDPRGLFFRVMVEGGGV